MKIRIIGNSGSGKSYWAKKLSKEYNIRHYDLDHIVWNNNSETYGIKNSQENRDEMLNEILKQDNWIIEGVYYNWCQSTFEQADYILVLQVPRRVYCYRILKRFFKRKIGLKKKKKESLKSLKELLCWTKKWEKKNWLEIKKLLEDKREKVVDNPSVICNLLNTFIE